MNRRGFFRGMLACAMAAASRVYAPSAFSTPKVLSAPVSAGFVTVPYISLTYFSSVARREGAQ